LSRPSWLVSYRDGLPARRQSPIQVLTGPNVEQLRWFDTTRCCYATPPTNQQQLETMHGLSTNNRC